MTRSLINIIAKIINGIFIIIIFDINCFGQVDSQRTGPDDSSRAEKTIIKSPRTAMLCSLIVPGLGQLYNGKKFKALIVFGAEVGLLSNSIYLNQMYKQSTYPADKEFYINNRNLSTWWLVGTILFSVLDAYVDAHLYHFDESPELSINFDRAGQNRNIVLSFSMFF